MARPSRRAPGRRRRALWLLPALVGGFVAVVAVEAFIARGRQYLPHDPGYVVDAVVSPPQAGPDVGSPGGADAGGDAAATPLRLVVLGDSTAAGVGSPAASEALPTVVAERVAAATGRPVHVTGLGVSGARTADVVDDQLPRVAGLGADVVVAVVGSNDVTHLTPPWRLRRQVEALAEAANNGDAPLVLAGIPLFSQVEAFDEPLRTVVRGYAWLLREVQREAAAANGVAYVDIARDASPRFAGVPEAMSRDDFHPGPVGYGFWADAIAPVVVRILEGPRQPPSAPWRA